ncbi:MAG: hypothetical protein HY754_13555 [Nitrospirae bacterium]|nr:hypothetical protein [Nitrospirota bacterium]
MQKVGLSGVTIDKLIHTAEMFRGFKKKSSILKQLDGKYFKTGIEMKKKGLTSVSAVREIREAN